MGTARTLLVGIVGGLLGHVLQVPAGALLGSMAAVAAYNVLRDGRARVPRWLRSPSRILIGATTGSLATPALLQSVGASAGWAVLCITAVAAVGLGLGGVLVRSCSSRCKVARYRDAGVKVLLAGDFVEFAVVQGVVDDVYAQAAELSFSAVEVASAQTVLSRRDKAELVRRAGSHGLQVFGEVGRKAVDASICRARVRCSWRRASLSAVRRRWPQ